MSYVITKPEIEPKHRDDREDRFRALAWDRSFIAKPGEPAATVQDEERSLLITFIAFAIIVALGFLAALALVNENGSGSVTAWTESMSTLLTPGV